MRKTLIVAQSEFTTLVRTKAFIISIVLMPILMALSGLVVNRLKDDRDVRDRRFAFVDASGVIGPGLEAALEDWNAATANGENRTLPRYFGEEVRLGGRSVEAVRLELSERVRREELFAFVEFPENILDPDAGAAIRYYSNHPSNLVLHDWLRATANRIVLAERFRAAAVDQALIARLTRQAGMENLGLFERDERGGTRAAQSVDPVATFGIPAVMMVLMYITVMGSAPQLLNSVIEEKMSRISEVLVASVTPFQLMMGKLTGGASVALLLACTYVAGGLGVAAYWGYAGAVRPALLIWFLLFLLMAVFMFGSIFIAIGAACTDLKDSQNMMGPVMLLVMSPMFVWFSVLRNPDSTLSILLSLVPTASPFLMMLRIGIQPGPPIWQVLLAAVLAGATMVVVVWAAGKIFRTGLLMQGKSATIPEMIRWVRAG
jgi:ABC-2 type transport system permease protein